MKKGFLLKKKRSSRKSKRTSGTNNATGMSDLKSCGTTESAQRERAACSAEAYKLFRVEGDAGCCISALRDADHAALNFTFKSLGSKLELMQEFSAVLASNATVMRLDLSCNNISGDGVRLLSAALAKNSTIRSLDLGANALKCEGVVCISKALTTNSTIELLDLRACLVADDGARALAIMLRGNKTLKVLNLASNYIGKDGGCALADGLKENTCLAALNLSSNEFDTQDTELCSILRHGKCILDPSATFKMGGFGASDLGCLIS